MWQSPRALRVILGLLLLGLIVSLLFHSHHFFDSQKKAECYTKYPLVNASIVCDNPEVIRKTGYISTQTAIEGYIQNQKTNAGVEEVSVYFRDLNHGPTFGINESETFAPASLLKLPLAMVFLRSAEIQPEVLSAKIKIQKQGEAISAQRVKPRVSAQFDQTYTIEELLRIMIVHSDNIAYEALENFLSSSPHRANLRLETFRELGLINPVDSVDETLSVRSYAAIFRILYNTSYLNADLSEKALSWLVEAEYADGLKRGVPAEVKVAHKFGERFSGEDSKQLHECGIVYYPGNPYTLCVMVRGKDWEVLSQTIGNISQMVYKEVDSRRY